MRRTRMSRSRTLSGLVTFLILAVVFVGSGYLIGKYLLASLLQRTPEGQPVSSNQPQQPVTGGGTTTTIQISTKPLTVYRVQIGAFSTQERAENAAQMAINKGVPAGVMSPDPLHKVYCGVLSSKEATQKLAEDALPKLSGIVGQSENLYVATLDIPGRTFSVTGTENTVRQIEKAFSTIENAIASLVGFWDQYYLKEQISVNLNSMKSDVAEVKAALEQITPDSGAQDAHRVALALATELESAISAAVKAQGGDSGGAVEGMTAVIKVIDSYVQDVKALE